MQLSNAACRGRQRGISWYIISCPQPAEMDICVLALQELFLAVVWLSLLIALHELMDTNIVVCVQHVCFVKI